MIWQHSCGEKVKQRQADVVKVYRRRGNDVETIDDSEKLNTQPGRYHTYVLCLNDPRLERSRAHCPQAPLNAARTGARALRCS
jgi:hypothetical protein